MVVSNYHWWKPNSTKTESVLSYLCLLPIQVLFETMFRSFEYNIKGKSLSNYSIKLICVHIIVQGIRIIHCFEGYIPECLSRGPRESLRCYISRRRRRREIKHLRDSREPRYKRSGIFPEKQWNICYVTFYSWKGLNNRSDILGAT